MYCKYIGHVANMGKQRNACSVLLGKPKGKIPVGRIRCKQDKNIKHEVLGKTSLVLTYDTHGPHRK
jgi:hypothetical protein